MKKIENRILIKTLVLLSIVFLFLSSGIALAEYDFEYQRLTFNNNLITPTVELKIYKPIDKKIVFDYAVLNLDVTTDKENYYVGEPITIAIENNGDKPVYFCGSSNHWIIEQNLNGEWKLIYPQIELAMFLNDYIGPGEKEIRIWNQKTQTSQETCEAGIYRVVVKYSTDENHKKFIFTKYAYFSINSILYKTPIIEIYKPNIIEIPQIYTMLRPEPVLMSRPEPIPIPVPEPVPIQDSIIIPLTYYSS